MRKAFLAGGLAVAAAAAIIAPVFAQTASTPSYMQVTINRSGHVQLMGTLASVSGTTLTVTSWGGSWSVDASSAKIVRRYGATSSVSEMQTGDILLIAGTMSPSGLNVAAKTIRDMSIQARAANVWGTVSALTGTGFTLTLRENGKSYQVTAGTGVQVYLNGKAGSWSDLQNGMYVRVAGVWDRTNSTVTASRIYARVPRQPRTPTTTPSLTPTPRQ